MHHTKAPWDAKRWPNFTASELACPCAHCGGEYYHWPEFLDRLQKARTIAGVPFNINSGHRCTAHNIEVRGAPLSQHLRLAVDIDVYGSKRKRLTILKASEQAGFTGYGKYQNMLHIDLRARPYTWFSGNIARIRWHYQKS